MMLSIAMVVIVSGPGGCCRLRPHAGIAHAIAIERDVTFKSFDTRDPCGQSLVSFPWVQTSGLRFLVAAWPRATGFGPTAGSSVRRRQCAAASRLRGQRGARKDERPE